MICPYCFSNNNHVTDTRWNSKKKKQRRRYECRDCDNRFTTYENYDKKTLKIVEKEE